jgi:hypothetical protein
MRCQSISHQDSSNEISMSKLRKVPDIMSRRRGTEQKHVHDDLAMSTEQTHARVKKYAEQAMA